MPARISSVLLFATPPSLLLCSRACFLLLFSFFFSFFFFFLFYFMFVWSSSWSESNFSNVIVNDDARICFPSSSFHVSVSPCCSSVTRGRHSSCSIRDEECRKAQDEDGTTLSLCVLHLGHVFFHWTTDHRNKEKSCRHRQTYQNYDRIGFLCWISSLDQPSVSHTSVYKHTYERILGEKFRECPDENSPGTQSSLFLPLLTVRR